MPLTLETRGVGDVTIVRCCGRIAAGGEIESLRNHFATLMPDRTDIVLHLGEVIFIDSSGLGTLVRLLTSVRRARGDLKLCNLPPPVLNVLKLTSLIKLFDTHASEEEAIAAFYQRTTTRDDGSPRGPSVLCLDHSCDVLAYLRELLRRAGYEVLTSSNMRDALILLRAASPKLVVLGPNLKSSRGIEEAFRSLSGTVPVVELGQEFSTLDAGQAAADLMERITAMAPVRPKMKA
jgi:anti-sigma B factor antagonist